MGMLVWDENHRNGQPAEADVLAKRDRNHPSIIIWSICNEVLLPSALSLSLYLTHDLSLSLSASLHMLIYIILAADRD